MDSKNVGEDGGLPDATNGLSSAPTLDQVYAAIMSQKRKAQELPPVPAALPEPVLRLRSGIGASVRNNTLEQLLLQGLTGGQEDGSLSIMRSNTMESILRDTLSGGRELQDLLLEWNHSMPEEKLVEGLASDMQAIDAAPPDVQAMRRTFTLERILSGAESDLAGMLRANHQQQQQQQQQHFPIVQLVRQHSGAAAAASAAAGTCGDSGSEGQGGHGDAAALAMRLGAGGGSAGCRPTDRLPAPQRQESLHRLAASSGPSQQLRPPSTGSAAAMGPPQPHSRTVVGNGGYGGGGGGGGGPGSGLLRAAHGSGRYGAAAAAALATAEDESLQQRSPKRHKVHHHLKAEGPLGAAPERTWSQSLLDLAKAAAALDGQDLDQEDAAGGGGGDNAIKSGLRAPESVIAEEMQHASQQRQGVEVSVGLQQDVYHPMAVSERKVEAVTAADAQDGDRGR
ncbi:hypothetical protein VaNZ11_003348, partial [Volvox africanus]